MTRIPIGQLMDLVSVFYLAMLGLSVLWFIVLPLILGNAAKRRGRSFGVWAVIAFLVAAFSPDPSLGFWGLVIAGIALRMLPDLSKINGALPAPRTKTVRYSATTGDEMQSQYVADAAKAKAAGWQVCDMRWEPDALDPTWLVTYEYVAPEGEQSLWLQVERRHRSPRPGRGWKAAMRIMAAFGFISSVLVSMQPGQAPLLFQEGNMAGIANGLIVGLLGALVWYGLAYGVFLATAAATEISAFARRRMA